MKIVLWIGNESNQLALAHKLASRFDLAGIVIESKKTSVKYTVKKVYEKIYEKLFLPGIDQAWFGMKDHYRQHYQLPPVTCIEVENINSEATVQFTRQAGATLIMVSGTRIIQPHIIQQFSPSSIINLHTGLSPYIKGGPNCTNWCISTGQFHLIGNTVMWLDPGIDSGNLISTELTTFTGNETLADVHLKVMEHAHDLYLRSVEQIIQGKALSVKQDSIATGKTYYTKNWTLADKKMLVKNFKKFSGTIGSEMYRQKKEQVITVPLPA